MDDIDRERYRRAAPAQDAPAPTPPDASTLLVRVFAEETLPAGTDRFYATHPVTVLGGNAAGDTPETAGSAATIYVDVIGKAPAAGDLLIARHVGYRWVAETGVGGNARVVVAGCDGPIEHATVRVYAGGAPTALEDPAYGTGYTIRPTATITHASGDFGQTGCDTTIIVDWVAPQTAGIPGNQLYGNNQYGDLAGAGSQAWEYDRLVDDTWTVELPPGTESKFIRLADQFFTSGQRQYVGILAQLNARLLAGSGVVVAKVRLVRGGQRAGDDKGDAWAPDGTWRDYGGASDEWGLGWTWQDTSGATGANVGVGLAVSFRNDSEAPATVALGGLRLRAYWETTAGGILGYRLPPNTSAAGYESAADAVATVVPGKDLAGTPHGTGASVAVASVTPRTLIGEWETDAEGATPKFSATGPVMVEATIPTGPADRMCVNVAAGGTRTIQVNFTDRLDYRVSTRFWNSSSGSLGGHSFAVFGSARVEGATVTLQLGDHGMSAVSDAEGIARVVLPVLLRTAPAPQSVTVTVPGYDFVYPAQLADSAPSVPRGGCEVDVGTSTCGLNMNDAFAPGYELFLSDGAGMVSLLPHRNPGVPGSDRYVGYATRGGVEYQFSFMGGVDISPVIRRTPTLVLGDPIPLSDAVTPASLAYTSPVPSGLGGTTPGPCAAVDVRCTVTGENPLYAVGQDITVTS